MRLIFYDGFEQFALGEAGEVQMTAGGYVQADFTDPSTDYARTGTRSLKMSNVGKTRISLGVPDAGGLTYVGMSLGIQFPALPTKVGEFLIMSFRNTDNEEHINLRIGTTGKLEVWNSGTATMGSLVNAAKHLIERLGQSSYEVSPGAFNHIEMRVSIEPSGFGDVHVWLNGVLVIELLNARTRGYSDAQFLGGEWVGIPIEGNISQVAIGTFSNQIASFIPGNIYVDDIVIYEVEPGGSDPEDEPDTPLGEYGVYYLRPVADTNEADWALTSGTTGYTLINEQEPDDDLEYIFSGTTGDVSKFEVQQLPVGTVAVKSVCAIARVRKTESGEATVKLGVDSGDVSESDDKPLTTVWAWHREVFDKDPSTDSAWDPDDMPLIQIKRSS